MKAFILVGCLLCAYGLVLPNFIFYEGVAFYKNKAITKYDQKMNFLNEISLIKNPRQIHNAATDLLKQNRKGEAILLLKKNFYTNLFIPSYFTLLSLKIPVSIFFLLWHLSLFIVSILCLLTMLLLIKSISLLRIRQLTILLSLGFVLSITGHWFLKPRLSSFKKMALRVTPSVTSSVKSHIAPNSDLLIIELKMIKGNNTFFYRAKDQNGEIGWVRKKDFLRLL